VLKRSGEDEQLGRAESGDDPDAGGRKGEEGQDEVSAAETAVGETWQLVQRALLVWAMFAVLSMAPVPERLVPLLSHAVGFGFYLVMVTRQSRWMIMVVVASCAMISLTARTVSPEWYPAATYAVAACALVLSLTLAAVFGGAASSNSENACADWLSKYTGVTFRKRASSVMASSDDPEFLVDIGVAVDLDRDSSTPTVSMQSELAENALLTVVQNELEERTRELESERGVRMVLEADLAATRTRLESVEQSKREADVGREWYVRALKAEEKAKSKMQRELQGAHAAEIRRLTGELAQCARELKLARDELSVARASRASSSAGSQHGSPAHRGGQHSEHSRRSSATAPAASHAPSAMYASPPPLRSRQRNEVAGLSSPSLSEYQRLERELEERVRNQKKLEAIAVLNQEEVRRQRTIIERLAEDHCDKLVETMTESLVADDF